MIKKLIFVSCLFNIVSTYIFAQDLDLLVVKKYAENSLSDGDFEYALENFLILYENNKKDPDLNYKLGICYTETNIDNSKAIPLLEYVVSHNNYPINSFYYLGRAYMYSYRFTEAVEAFYEFKAMGISEVLLSETDRLIEMCYYALELINQPQNITFERLDSTINSPFDDYYPFVNSDASLLLFSSNRTYVEDFEDYIANVFYSESKKGIWNKAATLPEVTSYNNEEIVGVSPNADKIAIYANGDNYTHDIKMVDRKGIKFSNIDKSTFPRDVNTEGIEMGACMSADGNTFAYASDRKGGRGGLDIYIVRKNPNGQWGQSENMGTTINTEFDENFPNLSGDGKRLYFASKGHDGIGGYDIFRTNFNEETQSWTPPLNLGFPINTPADNTTISFTADGKTAYMSTNRKEGFGKNDIYKITFGEESQQPSIVIGSVFVGTAPNGVPYSEDFLKAYATFYDTYDNIVAQYDVNSDGGQFFATLYPGTYKLEVKFSGAKSGYSENLTINQSNSSEPVAKKIYLKPIE